MPIHISSWQPDSAGAPVGLRYRMAFDADLTAKVLRAFLRTLFASLRRRARVGRRIHYPQCGSVSFVQRFGDALNLNVHFHVLALDGVFDADHPEGVVFFPLDSPDDTELLRIVRGFTRRLRRVLERFGIEAEAGMPEADPPVDARRLRAAAAHDVSLDWIADWWPVAPILLGGYLFGKAMLDRAAGAGRLLIG